MREKIDKTSLSFDVYLVWLKTRLFQHNNRIKSDDTQFYLDFKAINVLFVTITIWMYVIFIN